MTVNDHETHAVLDHFLGQGQMPEQVTKGGVTYNRLGLHGGCELLQTICEMGAGGIGASQQRAREAIQHWNPKAIIAVGVAFGLDETKQNIGDVLVSTQIQDYELSRLNENGVITPRGDKPSCADILRNRIRITDLARRRGSSEWPKVRFGLVLTGQKLVDNVDYRENLKSLFCEAIGGEMEGLGLYASTTACKVDWIIVKGICDWGHNKNQEFKDEWQELAANNAAKVVKAAFLVGGLYDVESDSQPQLPTGCVVTEGSQASPGCDLESQLQPTEGAVDPKHIGKVLFDRYSLECEKFYYCRTLDSEIEKILFLQSLWISGGCGIGKTIAIFRNLIRGGKPFLFVDLSRCIASPDTPELLRCLYEEVVQFSRCKGTELTGTESTAQYIKLIIDQLYTMKEFNLYIDEVPIADKEGFETFMNSLAAIIGSMSNETRVIVASIFNPTNFLKNFQQKVHEKLKFVHLESWSQTEVEGLLQLVLRHLPVDLTAAERDEVLNNSQGSPRFLKKFLKNYVTFNDGAEGWNFDRVLSETRRDLCI